METRSSLLGLSMGISIFAVADPRLALSLPGGLRSLVPSWHIHGGKVSAGGSSLGTNCALWRWHQDGKDKRFPSSTLALVLRGLLKYLRGSCDHRMVRVGRDLCGSPSPTPCPSRVTQSRLHRTASRRGLDISCLVIPVLASWDSALCEILLERLCCVGFPSSSYNP